MTYVVGCEPTCTPAAHRYTTARPFPHPAELQQAPVAPSQDEEARTDEMPRDPDLVPQDVSRRKRITVDGDTVPQLAETIATVLDPPEYRDFLEALLHHMRLPLPEEPLPAPPPGWAWASLNDPVLTGSTGLAHLLPASGRRPGLRSFCGLEAMSWVGVGHRRLTPSVPCPSCLDPTGGPR